MSQILSASHQFQFELNFNHTATSEWMRRQWSSSFYWSLLYLIVIFSARHWMKSRDPFNLRTALFVWNLFLAVFSIVGTIRTIPEFIDIWKSKGMEQSICDNRYVTDERSALWVWLHTLFKAVEFGDTVFIVLRKQNLIFLHWFHHASVLIFAWYVYFDRTSLGRWFLNINFAIHSIMYCYYAVRALRIRVPKAVAQLITSSQIIQMCVGLGVTCYALYVKLEGRPCQSSDSAILVALALYLSYLALFTNFFIKSYMKSSTQSKKRA